VLQCKDSLEQPGEARGGLEMPNLRLNAAHSNLLWRGASTAKEIAECGQLYLIALVGAGPMALH